MTIDWSSEVIPPTALPWAEFAIAGVLAAAIILLSVKATSKANEHAWLVAALFVGVGGVWWLFMAKGSVAAWGLLAGVLTSSIWGIRASNRRMMERDLEARDFATSLGLEFRSIDDELMPLLDAMVGEDGLAARRVLIGSWRGMPVRVGEYRFVHWSGDDPPAFGIARFAATRTERSIRRILIRRHNALTRIWDRVRRRSVTQQDPVFDHRFRVNSEPGSAPTLGYRERAWLLANDRYGLYLIDGQDVVVCAPYRNTLDDITELIEWLRAFRAVLETGIEANAP